MQAIDHRMIDDIVLVRSVNGDFGDGVAGLIQNTRHDGPFGIKRGGAADDLDQLGLPS
ncbi:MAG: hypothetical protein MZV49_18245 [Rhodopseudomonas palustris]|nr:hypothetical protein [Rhodopseudomonas palustris]